MVSMCASRAARARFKKPRCHGALKRSDEHHAAPAVVLSPQDFTARLCALAPPPRCHLLSPGEWSFRNRPTDSLDAGADGSSVSCAAMPAAPHCTGLGKSSARREGRSLPANIRVGRVALLLPASVHSAVRRNRPVTLTETSEHPALGPSPPNSPQVRPPGLVSTSLNTMLSSS